MSKKMLKRSLALGALMAFVITGSAMAAELNINSEAVYNDWKDGGIEGWTLDSYKAMCYEGSAKNDNKIIIAYDGEYEGLLAVATVSGDNVSNNNVTINAGTYWADAQFEVNGAYLLNGKAANNSVIINGGRFVFKSMGIYGAGSSSIEAILENNTLTISGGSFESTSNGGTNLAGAATFAESNGDKALSNTLNINSAENDVPKFNGKTWLAGGYSHNYDAINNKVNIEAGIFNGDTEIHGGRGRADAEYNEVIIQNAVFNSKVDVYGGSAKNTSSGRANNNTVTIGEGTVFNGTTNIYGANKMGTGNTLNINDGWTGKVASVQNFNNINFEEVEWGTPAIETGTLTLGDEGTKITVGTVRVAGDDKTFAPNGTYTLISADSITGYVSTDSSVSVFKGVATIYDATIEKSDNSKAINIVLGDATTAQYNPEMNPQVLVIGESRAAATAFTNQGSELIETGLNALARDEAEDTKAFAAVYGNASEFATGSHVKVNGWSGIVGVGKTNANGLTMGAFFENGEGNYRTYNNVNGDFMRGDGDACYNGGGFIVRKDNANGVYTEASLRAGNLQNELRNAVRGSEGLAGYDIDTFYYGAHIGIGKIIPRGTEGDSIDVYGKFIYTHHDSEDFTIDGDKFHFDSVDSERVRLGFRINEVQTNKLSMYYGAAWEYEFGGDADNTVVGYDLSTPSLEGSTVIGEVGMHYNASEKWSLDLNVRGYGGQREGFSGSVQANYSF